MRWLILLSVVASTAHAAPLKGLDLLGLAKQNVSMIAQELAPNSAVGVLQGTFGDVIPPLERLLATGKVKAFRAHLLNGTCKRNRVCESGEPQPNNVNAIRARAQQFELLHQKYPNVACYLSPVLEHDEKDKRLVNEWIKILKEYAPTCNVIISAYTGFRPKGQLQEYHGNGAGGDIVSNDGDSLFDSNPRNYKKAGRLIVFGWISACNLRTPSEKAFTPPSKRSPQLALTKEQVRKMQALLH